MTGSGTQTDPYIVDNWADFRTIDTNSAEIYVRWADVENKTIDFNDIMPEGFSGTVNFPANVDFNGWTLKNFHSTSNTVLTCSSAIENLTLENFYTTSDAQTLFYCACLLKNCIISGIVQCGGNAVIFSGCGLKNCSLNIRVNATSATIVSTGGFLHPKSQITNSDIILDIYCSNSVSISNTPIKNSRISGKIRSNTTKITLGSSTSMSNIFNIEAVAPLEYTSSAISVYNSDFADSTSNSTRLVGVTSEQLKNAEYLYNIGFPIGVD